MEYQIVKTGIIVLRRSLRSGLCLRDCVVMSVQSDNKIETQYLGLIKYGFVHFRFDIHYHQYC